jgi:DNA polymerase epsilon subunit 1
MVEREDLEMTNHLSGKRHTFLKMSFGTVAEMNEAKQALRPVVAVNRKRMEGEEYFEDTSGLNGDGNTGGATGGGISAQDPLSCIIDLREYDVPYMVRVAIDLDLRVGAWYTVAPVQGSEACDLVWQRDLLELCEPRVLAFDIECEKAPLKFPNAEVRGSSSSSSSSSSCCCCCRRRRRIVVVVFVVVVLLLLLLLL